jgi:hypothetical protein
MTLTRSKKPRLLGRGFAAARGGDLSGFPHRRNLRVARELVGERLDPLTQCERQSSEPYVGFVSALQAQRNGRTGVEWPDSWIVIGAQKRSFALERADPLGQPEYKLTGAITRIVSSSKWTEIKGVPLAANVPFGDSFDRNLALNGLDYLAEHLVPPCIGNPDAREATT